MAQMRPAVFLDRDGTINVDRSYLTKPEQLELLPDVGAALGRLRSAGFACVVVTNQSAVGRGMMTDADLERIHEHMQRQLHAVGAVLDGVYACPFAEDHPERKPAPGMLLRAAAELHLDLASSWMIGDCARDIEAGRRAGCLGGILVRTGQPFDDAHLYLAGLTFVADSLSAAAAFILER